MKYIYIHCCSLNLLIFCTVTAWSLVLLEKLVVVQSCKKLPAFYAGLTTRPCPEPDESSPHPTITVLQGP